MQNTGAEPVEYDRCREDVKLSVSGVATRKLPNIYGCYGGSGGGFGCVIGHPPRLSPGKTMTSKHLPEGYDLKPGRYRLIVSDITRVPPKYTDAQLDYELSLTVVAASESELRKSFEPLIADVTRDSREIDLGIMIYYWSFQNGAVTPEARLSKARRRFLNQLSRVLFRKATVPLFLLSDA